MLLTFQERIERLERRSNLMMGMLDKSKDYWAYFLLEHDLTADQGSGLATVMEVAHQAIEKGEPFDQVHFENRLLPFIPTKEKPNDNAYDFVKFMLMTFGKTGQWHDVVEHYRKDYNC